MISHSISLAVITLKSRPCESSLSIASFILSIMVSVSLPRLVPGGWDVHAFEPKVERKASGRVQLRWYWLYTRPGLTIITFKVGHISFKNYSASSFVAAYFSNDGRGIIEGSALMKTKMPFRFDNTYFSAKSFTESLFWASKELS